MKTLLISLSFFFFSISLFAQNQDCVTSIELTTKDSIVVTELNGNGDVNETFENDCIDANNIESQSSWYAFTAYEAGTFNFTIKPNNREDDLDFYLFKTQSGFCAGLESIRCNASSCLGSLGYTGIATNDSDLFEDLNCEEGENSYSKEVELEKDQKYYLMVNNFTQNEGFTIVFCGTAKLGPDDMVCNNGILHTEAFSDKTYSITPNPASEYIQIQDYQEIETMDLYNVQGIIVEHFSKVTEQLILDQPSGMYYMKMHLKDGKIALTPMTILNN